MKILVPMPIDLSVLANGRTLRIVHLLNELHRRMELVCLVPADERAETARQALPDLNIETAGSATQSTVETETPWPTDLLPYTGLTRRALGYMGIDQSLLRETVTRASHFDAVLGFDLPTLAYLLAVRQTRSGPAPRVVYDAIDDPLVICKSMPASIRFSWGGFKQAIAVRHLRQRRLREMDAITAVSPLDALSLRQVTGLDVAVVPNGVALVDESLDDRQREPLVIFTGAMQFPPNATAACWMAQRIWPLVLKAFRQAGITGEGGQPPVRLAIVGTSPTKAVQKLARIPGVEVTGRVDALYPWLRRARVAVAPMISGSGIKNKVLEACAAACPVVATSLGVAGLPTGPEQGVIVADMPEDFAQAVVSLLCHPDRANYIGRASRRMVATHYAWSSMADRLFDVMARTAHIRSVEPLPCGALNSQGNSSRVSGDEEALPHATS